MALRFNALLLTLLLVSAFPSGCGDSNAPANPDASDPPETLPLAGETLTAQKSQPDDLDPLVEQVVANPLGSHVSDRRAASLEHILETRFLRVLTTRNSFDFFIHSGKVGGYQYDLVKGFTKSLNERHTGKGELRIQFELIPVGNDELIPMLLAGRGDMIAARLTITPERATQVRFSIPYRSVDEVLVTHAETGDHAAIESISGKSVFVRPSSSYFGSLVALNDKLESLGLAPVRIQPVDESLETERILDLVAAGRFDYSVADSFVAEVAAQIHPNLRILDHMPVRQDGQLAWATTLGAAALADVMNAFLKRHEAGSLMGNLAHQKHFEADGRLMKRLRTQGDGTLSDHDTLFKKYAAEYELDWRLMAALAFQESRFDPLARNRSGATGLLQIKPVTAREPYIGISPIEGVEHVENNIEAGIKYIDWIKRRYFDSDPTMRERDRVRMALGAYNAGPRRIILARQRASDMGLDPNKWFRNVEVALLDMGRTEPVKYVSDINQRYIAYLLLGID